MPPERDASPERPRVWVNCAISLDGKLAFAGGARAPLSSPEDLVRVQRLRAGSDAILVGVGTVLLDDPSLRVHWDLLNEPEGKHPTRVIVDGSGRLPPTARVLDGSVPTIVATSARARPSLPPHVDRIVAGTSTVDLPLLFERLGARGIRRLMVEGGAGILASVLRGGLFDRFTVYTAPVVIGGSTAPPLVRGPEVGRMEDALRLRLVGVEALGEGSLATYVPRGPSTPP
ncbi:MAG TPA: dihydrofolate reductase family protein [Thermoplasmata archaeon]|nr:dihydrofolate reductase family protein [Thermoplasmata archaeon]